MLLLDITNWLIGLGFSDRLRNLIKSWSGVLQVTWPLSIRISDHSVSKILSSSITGRYPRPTLCPSSGGWEVLPIWRSAVGVFNSPSQKFSKTLTKTITYLKRCHNLSELILMRYQLLIPYAVTWRFTKGILRLEKILVTVKSSKSHCLEKSS